MMFHVDIDRCVYIRAYRNAVFNFKQYAAVLAALKWQLKMKY